MATNNASRREFLKRAGALSVTGVAAPLALNLTALGEAAAANASGYKALVCVFLYGGNDYANTLVSFDKPSHDVYTAERPAFAYTRAQLSPYLLTPKRALPDGRQYALAPELAPLLKQFDNGQLAGIMNMGTLVEPVSKYQYTKGLARLPTHLFSHNDQQSDYLSGKPEGSVAGWGGRMGDLYAAENGKSIFTCIGMSGDPIFISGNKTVAYQMSSRANGAIPIKGLKSWLFGSSACTMALKKLITADSNHILEASHSEIVRRSLKAAGDLDVLQDHPNLTAFPRGNNLASQLAMVSRVIAARSKLQAKRQVFFVSLGGFDNHDSLLTDHPDLLKTVAEALASFQKELATLNIEDQVTTFTASDFGRTLNSDNDGSDHGWGSMHFVMGGSVNGQNLYGTAPVMGNNGPDDVGRGRLLPTIAVDQFSATLGKWFGVSDTELLDIYPNLRNFDANKRDIGFMKRV